MTPALAERRCPGLPAEWVNGWLAAVGAAVLDAGITLRWTTGPAPIAVLVHPALDPADAIASAWPDRQRIDCMPTADLGRKVPLAVLRSAIDASRGHPDSWTLTSTLTDLAADKDEAAHGRFDPAAPGSTGSLTDRLKKIHDGFPPDSGLPDRIRRSLDGIGQLEEGNGLGFDLFRLPDRARSQKQLGNYVDPIVELLAFFALARFPVRGDGVTGQGQARQRGHGIGPHNNGVFAWPAWSQPLDVWGIDALLDAWHGTWRLARAGGETRAWRTRHADWQRLGVHAGWRTIQYQYEGSDSTRGYGSARIVPYRRQRRLPTQRMTRSAPAQ